MKLEPENDTGAWGKLEYHERYLHISLCAHSMKLEMGLRKSSMHAPTGNIIVLKIRVFHDFHLQLYNLEPKCAYDKNIRSSACLQNFQVARPVLASQPRPQCPA